MKANPETCEKCPHRFTKQGCPAWISEKAGFVKTNIASGAEEFVTGCFYQVIPWLMVEVVKASNRPAAVMESTRNEIVAGFTNVARTIAATAAQLTPPTRLQLDHDGTEYSNR